MSIFWVIYFIAAITVPGIFALLLRRDIKQGKVVKITLPEGLLGAVFTLVPVLNALMAIVLTWFYISEYGDEHSITFGKDKE